MTITHDQDDYWVSESSFGAEHFAFCKDYFWNANHTGPQEASKEV
jgi:hypothetical protein